MQVKWLVLTLHIIMSRLVQTAESLAGYRAVGKFVFINTGWRKYYYRDITSGQSRSYIIAISSYQKTEGRVLSTYVSLK